MYSFIPESRPDSHEKIIIKDYNFCQVVLPIEENNILKYNQVQKFITLVIAICVILKLFFNRLVLAKIVLRFNIQLKYEIYN